MSKAWFVWVGDPGLDWGDFVHGETDSKAKAMFWAEWSSTAEEYTWLRPIRCQNLDDVPLTEENILKHLKGQTYEGEPYTEWYSICNCEICKM